MQGQDPYRFIHEVDSLSKLHISHHAGSRVILFTGSSSIKLWNDAWKYFPGRTIINTGFGGSHMSDLLFFLDELVFRYSPDQVIIYEGDNDLASGKEPATIMKDAERIVAQLQDRLPGIKIALISAKPSLARWELKENYKQLNRLIREYAEKKDDVEFIDIWPLMLDEKNEPGQGLFLEDGLHMNKAGYDLWAGEIEKILIK